jgi:hypothetical protein
VSSGSARASGGAVRGSAQRVAVLRALALAALPLVLLSLWHVWRMVQDGEARLAAERIALVRVAAEAADNFLDSNIATLRGLALSPAVRDPSL